MAKYENANAINWHLFQLNTSAICHVRSNSASAQRLCYIDSTLCLWDVEVDSSEPELFRCVPPATYPENTRLGVSWRDHVTNEELMRRSGMQSLSEMVKTWRLRLDGHVLRQPEDRPANVAINCIQEVGKRFRGRPQKAWRTTFAENLQDMRVTWRGAKRVASDRQR